MGYVVSTNSLRYKLSTHSVRCVMSEVCCEYSFSEV